MNIINQVLLIAVSFAVPIGCSHNIRILAAIPHASWTNHNLQIANKEAVETISLKELLDRLPPAPQGWTAAKPKGETNSWGDYYISQVRQTYTNKDKEVTISIFDWSFNSTLHLPLLLTTQFSQESTEGYNKGIELDGIPGREEYTYDSRQGSLNLLVDSRFLVQIDGSNIENTELRDWWQLINLQSF